MNLGGTELLIVVAIAVLLFGAGWLPKAAKNLGKAKVEFDDVQRQFNETKESAVKATGIKELEATVRKANKVINTSPQKLMKDAAKSAVTGSGAAAASNAATADEDDDIEDAEIVEPSDSNPSDSKPGDNATAAVDTTNDTNINIDFQ